MITNRTRLATVSLKCNSIGNFVDIYWLDGRLDNRDVVPYACEFVRQEDREFRVITSIHNADTCSAPAEKKETLKKWLPRAGLMYFISTLCRHEKIPIDGVKILEPEEIGRDPQKSDMTLFRKRSRHDVLRVVYDRLNSPTDASSISLEDLKTSNLLTRLYNDDDLSSGMRYWAGPDFRFLTNPTFGSKYMIDESCDEQIARLVQAYDWEECQGIVAAGVGPDNIEKADVFICHASEDKDTFVRSLAKNLREAGLTVWYDEYTLKLGDSLRGAIDRGLVTSRYGLVVLSKAFFEKKWPQYELDGLVQREINDQKVVLPIWHGVSRADVEAYSPSLANRMAVGSDRPMHEIVSKVKEVASPPSQM